MKNNLNNRSKVGGRNWLIFIIIGFAGQLAWSLENMYLNSFIFDLGYQDYQTMITWTVALSAITACLTTIIMGGLSDKFGRRKVFICGGYLLWGLSTAAFGLVNSGNVKSLLPFTLSAFNASIIVIVLDCVMTFFGSTANDAAFNSYVTRNVKNDNRAKVEGVLSVLPLMSMLAITVLSGIATSGHWDYFFFIIGGFVFVVGIVALFLVPKEKTQKNSEPYFSLLLEGFKPSVIRKNPMLYIVLIADYIFCAASQIFFPYMIIYFNKTLGIVDLDFYILMGTVLIVGSILAIIGGFIMDKTGKIKMMIPWILLYIAGLVLIFFVPKGNLIFAILAGILMMFGYIVLTAAINAIIRDYTPSGKEGIFQGIRMIFQVALPMVSGPYLAQLVVTYLSNETFVNEYGQIQKLPPNYIWLFAAVGMLLIFIPVIILLVKDHKQHKLDNQGLLYDQDK